MDETLGYELEINLRCFHAQQLKTTVCFDNWKWKRLFRARTDYQPRDPVPSSLQETLQIPIWDLLMRHIISDTGKKFHNCRCIIDSAALFCKTIQGKTQPV